MRLLKRGMNTFQDLVGLVKCMKFFLESIIANPKCNFLRFKHTGKNNSMIKIFLQFSMINVV